VRDGSRPCRTDRQVSCTGGQASTATTSRPTNGHDTRWVEPWYSATTRFSSHTRSPVRSHSPSASLTAALSRGSGDSSLHEHQASPVLHGRPAPVPDENQCTTEHLPAAWPDPMSQHGSQFGVLERLVTQAVNDAVAHRHEILERDVRREQLAEIAPGIERSDCAEAVELFHRPHLQSPMALTLCAPDASTIRVAHHVQDRLRAVFRRREVPEPAGCEVGEGDIVG
jgi:hypothetical protein